MRLEYCIVWFEDSQEYIDSLEPQIRDYLNKWGFDLDLVCRKDDSNFLDIFGKKDVNLILVDQNLSQNKKGADLIDAIRKHELYTETVFYAQDEDLEKTIRQLLEGIYYARRHNLLEKIKTVINLTIKKNQDISNIRGLFIAETVDLIGRTEEIISKLLKLQGAELKFFDNTIILEESFNELAKWRIIRSFLGKKIEDLNQEIRSTGDAKGNLSPLKSDLERVKDVFDRFQTEVIRLRNDLAHSKRVSGKKITLKVKNRNSGCFEETEFDEERCTKLRQSFVTHSRNLEELEKLLDKL